MKANELRIGNWIDASNSHHETPYAIVAEVGRTVVALERENTSSLNEVKLKDVAPIAITPELLKTIGFEYRMNEWHYYPQFKDAYGFTGEWNNGLFYSAGEGLKLSNSCQYLHQLQNLFHALTGEELPVKL